MKAQFLAKILCLVLVTAGCTTGRDMTSKHYIPEWENQIIHLPAPSETSGGYWVVKSSRALAKGIGRVLLVPFALVGNVVIHAYYIPTWPFRWLFRGDKRLIVWHPLFEVGDEVGSDFYSEAWNRDIA